MNAKRQIQPAKLFNDDEDIAEELDLSTTQTDKVKQLLKTTGKDFRKFNLRLHRFAIKSDLERRCG